MSSAIIYNPARVHHFVSGFLPLAMTSGMKGIGLERDGELVAGVVYEGFNGRNMWMHVAAQFAHGQGLRARIEAATTAAEVAGMVW
jgi:hypothetical protein